jgi:uncharacterized protein YndB with AHSA1/START domain
VISREFAAPRRLVFAAYTSPEHVPNWMLGPPGWSMPVCEIDLRVGGAWRFVWRSDAGAEMSMRGVYLEIEPSERLVSRDTWGEGGPELLNTLLLAERDGRTALTNRLLFATGEARDAALRTGMAEGMAQTFERLEAHLAAMG